MQHIHSMAMVAQVAPRSSRRLAQLCARTVLAGAIGHLFLSAGIMAVASLPMSAHAADVASADFSVRKNFDIPAGPLEGALNRFGREAGILVSAQTELLNGQRTNGLKGNYNVREALPLLLQGTDLTAVIDGSVVTMHRRAVSVTASTEATLPAVTVRSEIGASTEGTGSYAARKVTLGKGEQALKDIPQSISVVTRQLMDEQNITTVYDALASTTGITVQQSPQGGKYIYSRGFDLATVQYDGIPLNRGMYGRASNYSASMAIYDRVEVLRGAAGLLQGGGNPSGAINLARKRVLAAPTVSAEVRAGSWNRYGLQLDASGFLNEDGSLRGRAVIDHEDQHSFIDYTNKRNTTLYATLEYDISAQTQISLGASSEETNGMPFLNGLPRFTNGEDVRLPRSTFFGASWNRQKSTNEGLYFDISHAFNDDWKFKLAAAYVKEKHDMKYAGNNRAVVPALSQGALLVARSLVDTDIAGLDANLTGKFDAFGRRHEVVVGATYADAYVDTTYGFRQNYSIFNIYNPSINIPEPTDDFIYSGTRENKIGKTREIGLYNAFRVQLTDPLKLIVGGRLSWSSTDYFTNTTGTSPSVSSTSNRENGRLTPYAGLIYELSPQWNAYVSYSDIFKPQSEQNEAGDLLKPAVGSNYEAGIKGELMDGRANVSFAVFRIEQANRAQVDFSTSPTCRSNYYCYTDSGKVRSEGFDAEISGELARGWNLFAGYTLNKTTYLQDVSSQGQTFNTYTPKHLFRLWNTYQLGGDLSAFTIGGGVNAQSASYRLLNGVTANMSGRAVWNAMVRYQINPKWTASLNLNNVFDKNYYSSVANLVNSNYYGEPRNVMLTVRGKF